MDRRHVFGVTIAHHDLVDQLCQLCRLGLCRRVTGMRQDDPELVAAQPPDNVRFPCAFEQNIRHAQQHIIPGSMSEDVIDLLEMIEIDENKRERCTETTGDRYLTPHLPLERTPVEHGAERIIVREQFCVGEGIAQARSLFPQVNDLLTERFKCRTFM